MIGHRPYNRSADVYSFGLVLWETLTGELPFAGLNAVQAAFAVVNKVSLRFPHRILCAHRPSFTWLYTGCVQYLSFRSSKRFFKCKGPGQNALSDAQEVPHEVICILPGFEMESVDSYLLASLALQHRRPVIPPECPASVKSLILACWHANPSKRPDFASILATLDCAIEDLETPKSSENQESSKACGCWTLWFKRKAR